VNINELAGFDLGSCEIRYTSRDAILYALTVGASASQLDLVYERDLRVLPTYACALGLWAVEKAGDLGAYDRKRSLHASQELVIHKPLPRDMRTASRGKVEAVWDRGKATIVEISCKTDFFDALYTIFLPGIGGWGGPAPGAPEADSHPSNSVRATRDYATSPNQAALYRLTGDLHPIHIDAEVARANGFDQPILHGLCTLGISARLIAEAHAMHPCDLRRLKARLSAPVMPGEAVTVIGEKAGQAIHFGSRVGERAVIKGGQASFVG
jgi:acyl dehydratase